MFFVVPVSTCYIEDMEQEPWVSDRKRIEMDDADRLRYFDMFIDPYLNGQQPFDVAVQGYKDTLEHQGIPLVPQRLGGVAVDAAAGQA